jgi:AraC family transcriptional regulator
LLLVAFLPEAFAQSSAALACPALMPQVDVESSQVRNTLSKLADVARQSDPFSMLYGNALASLLAAEIFYNQAGPAITRSGRFARGGLAGWQERQARDYIQSHLSEEIRIDHLARMVRLSVFHFCRAFKCTFGIPPHKYQLARRVEQAKELLIGSSLPVTSIAFRLGFGGTSQFSTVFRKMTGTTPTSYRRRLGLGEPDCVGEGDANSPPETASG